MAVVKGEAREARGVLAAVAEKEEGGKGQQPVVGSGGEAVGQRLWWAQLQRSAVPRSGEDPTWGAGASGQLGERLPQGQGWGRQVLEWLLAPRVLRAAVGD